MDDLKRMAVFAAVVRQGSMTAAGRTLGMSASAVSQQVRQLERDGGVTLLHRSTRKLRLTEAGERYSAHCAAMVAAAEGARAELSATREAPQGELRLSAPVGFARHVAPALGPLLAAHPALKLRLLVDDARIDLIEARIDLAVRFGKLPDSTWAARRLCGIGWLICAAPEALAAQPAPVRPQDLQAMQWLHLGGDHSEVVLDLTGPAGERELVHAAPRIASNNQLSIQQMCRAGLGLALLGSVDVHDELQAGRLVTVLPQWRLAPLDVWAVTPQRDAQPAKVRLAIDALQAYLRALPGVVP